MAAAERWCDLCHHLVSCRWEKVTYTEKSSGRNFPRGWGTCRTSEGQKGRAKWKINFLPRFTTSFYICTAFAGSAIGPNLKKLARGKFPPSRKEKLKTIWHENKQKKARSFSPSYKISSSGHNRKKRKNQEEVNPYSEYTQSGRSEEEPEWKNNEAGGKKKNRTKK